MKHVKHLPLIISSMLLLAACSSNNPQASLSVATSSKDSTSQATSKSSSATTTEVTTSKAEDTYEGGASTSVEVDTSNFVISSEDGSYAESDGVFTISEYGSYDFSGTLVGQIFVNVPETEDDSGTVELNFNGVDISYEGNSPIYIKSADEVKIKAKKNTKNSVTDLRALESVEDETQGGGAIYAKSDLKFVGTGELVVTGTYNNGVHTTKDLKVKNQTLTVTAPNNALKGNDSVTIESGVVTAISTAGDAIKTSNTDLSSSGKQRGTVTLSGGTINLYAAYDGVDAAYDAIVTSSIDDDGLTVTPNVTIKTSTYSSYTAKASANAVAYNGYDVAIAPGPGGGGGGFPGGGGGGGGWHDDQQGNPDKSDESAKGIKADNIVQVDAGVINIESYDDGLHANYATVFDSGTKGVGDVLINGGDITVTAYDDAFHADRYLKIAGGTIKVISAYEGLEGNQIYISGGELEIYGTDDAINAGNSDSMAGLTSYLEVTGGYVFAAVPSNGDTDCIDSNGNIAFKGGTVIACGPASGMASALDCEYTVTATGGTLVLFGGYEKAPSGSSLTSSSKSGTYGSGKSYTVTFTNGSVQTKNLPSYSYRNCYAWSELGSLTSIN